MLDELNKMLLEIIERQAEIEIDLRKGLDRPEILSRPSIEELCTTYHKKLRFWIQ